MKKYYARNKTEEISKLQRLHLELVNLEQLRNKRIHVNSESYKNVTNSKLHSNVQTASLIFVYYFLLKKGFTR